ncbi:MAG: hypothetical protein IKJ65_06960 [Clostridia bacterium]|nr:hypothetical protein [Clostridia bacterium]
MTNNGFAADFLQILLGWLQSLFNSVWALFSGGSGGSLLRWFSENWLGLLVALLIAGVVTDVVVYLFRWRPFWWWFRKKRLVIDDEAYDDYLGVKVTRTNDGRYVVPSTIVKRNRKREEDDFEDEDIFDVRNKRKKRDPFEVDAKNSRTNHRHWQASRRKGSR